MYPLSSQASASRVGHGTSCCTTTGKSNHTKELDLWNSTVLCAVCTVQRQRKPTGISTKMSRNWNRGTSNFSSSTVTETPTPRQATLPSICIPPWTAVNPSGRLLLVWSVPTTHQEAPPLRPTRAANECHGRPCRLPG